MSYVSGNKRMMMIKSIEMRSSNRFINLILLLFYCILAVIISCDGMTDICLIIVMFMLSMFLSFLRLITAIVMMILMMVST